MTVASIRKSIFLYIAFYACLKDIEILLEFLKVLSASWMLLGYVATATLLAVYSTLMRDTRKKFWDILFISSSSVCLIGRGVWKCEVSLMSRTSDNFCITFIRFIENSNIRNSAILCCSAKYFTWNSFSWKCYRSFASRKRDFVRNYLPNILHERVLNPIPV